MKTLKILIDENKRTWGYCDFGEMEGSNVIEVEDDFVWRGDPTDYVLEEGKLVYSPDLAKIKNRINEKWKQERQSKVDADLEYKGSVFQMRENVDVKNFEQRGLQIALGQKKLTDREEWRLKDNVFKEFSYEELLQVVELWGERKKRIWVDLKRMWLELEKATSVEEIEKITWE